MDVDKKERFDGGALPEGVVVFDCETTAFRHPNTNKHDPSPFVARNRMFHYAWKRDASAVTVRIRPGEVAAIPAFKLLVGHNIKFDLLWGRKSVMRVSTDSGLQLLWPYIVENATIWDTQLAEYLCSGQTIMFPSLEACCERRGIPVAKTLNLSDEIALHDGDLEKIPEADVAVYVMNDVEMTTALFLKQIEDPYVQKNFNWFLAQMEAELAETAIEYNGTSVDMDLLMSKLADGTAKRAACHAAIKLAVEKIYGATVAEKVNLDSPQQVAAVLYGGTVKWEEREEVGVYKSGAKLGQPRYKVVKTTEHLRGLVPPPEYTEGGTPSTSDETLQKLLVSAKTCPPAHSRAWSLVAEIVEPLMEMRELSKAIGTTLSGIAKYTLPDPTTGQMVVRPQMNNTSTATGRRSSSKPNGQNYPTNDPLRCKEVLGPRSKGRVIVSIDFKQAEIMGLAFVANDERLMQDIIDGVDIHKKMGEKAFPGRTITKEERRIVKTVVFGTIYGGGVETLAAQAGVTERVAQSILDALATTYPASWTYMSKIVLDVRKELILHGEPTDIIEKTPIGAQRVPRVLITSITGRKYAFRGFWRTFTKAWAPSSTQPKNYFIQGLATADLVPMCVGRVWRWLELNYFWRAEMIGAIHDSIVFEVDKEILDKFIKEVLSLISEAGNYLVETCNIPRRWTMPVRCDVEVGTNLGDLKPYE